MDLNQTSGIAREIELAKLTVLIGKLLLHRTDAFTVTEPTRSHYNVGPTPFGQCLVCLTSNSGNRTDSNVLQAVRPSLIDNQISFLWEPDLPSI